MQYNDAMEDTREGGLGEAKGNPAAEAQTAPPIVLYPNRKLGRGWIVGCLVLVVVLGILIVRGIHARVHAEETLVANTRQDAVLSVAVTTPSVGADALEVTLPANTQAFIDTPI
jgi:hypothetical protein